MVYFIRGEHLPKVGHHPLISFSLNCYLIKACLFHQIFNVLFAVGMCHKLLLRCLYWVDLDVSKYIDQIQSSSEIVQLNLFHIFLGNGQTFYNSNLDVHLEQYKYLDYEHVMNLCQIITIYLNENKNECQKSVVTGEPGTGSGNPDILKRFLTLMLLNITKW